MDIKELIKEIGEQIEPCHTNFSKNELATFEKLVVNLLQTEREVGYKKLGYYVEAYKAAANDTESDFFFNKIKQLERGNDNNNS